MGLMYQELKGTVEKLQGSKKWKEQQTGCKERGFGGLLWDSLLFPENAFEIPNGFIVKNLFGISNIIKDVFLYYHAL